MAKAESYEPYFVRGVGILTGQCEVVIKDCHRLDEADSVSA